MCKEVRLFVYLLLAYITKYPQKKDAMRLDSAHETLMFNHR